MMMRFSAVSFLLFVCCLSLEAWTIHAQSNDELCKPKYWNTTCDNGEILIHKNLYFFCMERCSPHWVFLWTCGTCPESAQNTVIVSSQPTVLSSQAPSQQPSLRPSASLAPSFSAFPSQQPSQQPSMTRAPSQFPSRRVFVTSTKHQGNLGGLAGADAICQGLADAQSLGGSFRAWLSDGTGSPATRFNKSMGPYVLVDGEQVAQNWDDLVDGQLDSHINLDETGTNVNDYVLTNTHNDGTPIVATNGDGMNNRHCQNWSSNVSPNDILSLRNPPAVGYTRIYSWWTYTGISSGRDVNCAGLYRLYCFEQA